MKPFVHSGFSLVAKSLCSPEDVPTTVDRVSILIYLSISLPIYPQVINTYIKTFLFFIKEKYLLLLLVLC